MIFVCFSHDFHFFDLMLQGCEVVIIVYWFNSFDNHFFLLLFWNTNSFHSSDHSLSNCLYCFFFFYEITFLQLYKVVWCLNCIHLIVEILGSFSVSFISTEAICYTCSYRSVYVNYKFCWFMIASA